MTDMNSNRRMADRDRGGMGTGTIAAIVTALGDDPWHLPSCPTCRFASSSGDQSDHYNARILALISVRKATSASSTPAPLSGVKSVIPQWARRASCRGFDDGMNTNERGR